MSRTEPKELSQSRLNMTNGKVDDPGPGCSTSTASPKVNGSGPILSDHKTQKICTNGTYHRVVSGSHSGMSDVATDSGECQQANPSCSGVAQKTSNKRKATTCSEDDRNSRNSSSEDEDCWIYTYKGGDCCDMADLPSSFYRLDVVPSRVNQSSRNSSPDMDYLEMDFDPGPGNEMFITSESETRENVVMNALPLHLAHEQVAAEQQLTPRPKPPPALANVTATKPASLPSSPAKPVSQSDIDPSILQHSFCYCVNNKMSQSSIDENFNDGEEGTSMIWKEEEAKEKQVNQIAPSACGATAVINVLLGLNVPFSVNTVKQHVATRLRNETALVPEYLHSRCHAGATHEDMIRGLHNSSNQLVYARFFHMFPERVLSLSSWLSHWIRKGAVPIVTRNLQRGVRPGDEVPDWWHHQMVYGVSKQGIHLTNPLEIQSENLLWSQLCSPSVLKIRRSDVLSRWTPETSLLSLINPALPLWRKLNVLGQVANVVREHCQTTQEHITIPASYCSGVILVVLRSSPAYDELRFAPELPNYH